MPPRGRPWDSISRDGNTRLPKRNGVAGQTADGGSLTVTIQGGPGDHVCA